MSRISFKIILQKKVGGRGGIWNHLEHELIIVDARWWIYSFYVKS